MSHIPFYPLVFAVYPVVLLWSNNASDVQPVAFFTSLLVVLAVAALGYGLARLILRDVHRAALATTWTALMFFLYGAVYSRYAAWYERGGNTFDGLSRNPALVWVTILLVGLVLVVWQARRLKGMTAYLNLLGLLLVFVAAVTGAFGFFSAAGAAPTATRVAAAPGEVRGPKPDIYLIILDAYVRPDVYRKVFGRDISGFVESLEEMGFYVAPQARSNYASTSLSISSMLNFTYLDDISAKMDPESEDLAPLVRLLRRPAAADMLREYGYEFVAFSSGCAITEMRSADVFLEPDNKLSEFQNVLINHTPLPIALRRLGLRSALHRERLEMQFESLPDVAGNRNPRFVFSHVVCPHPPFVLGPGNAAEASESLNFDLAEGMEPATEAERRHYRKAYAEQLEHLNEMVLDAVRGILKKSRQSPIIVITGDHGSGLNRDSMEERFSILYAVHFPDAGPQPVPEDITPINTFPIIFNRYLGADMPLLENRHIFSRYTSPYRQTELGADLQSLESEKRPQRDSRR